MSPRSFFFSNITDANRFAAMTIVVAFNQIFFFSLSEKTRDESLAFFSFDTFYERSIVYIKQ
jgi:hypothetical protein